MKRYVRSSIASTEPYKKYPARKVTEGFLADAKVQYTIDVVDGILSWKSDYAIQYHHINQNTHINTVKNVALIDSSAHGFLHSASIELKLMRHYQLLLPGYGQGHRAEELEHRMYAKLFKDLCNKYNCTAQAIIDSLESLDIESATSDEVQYHLQSDTNIHVVSKSDIEDVLNSSNIDYTSRPNMIYVDEDTQKAVNTYLNDLRDTNRDDEITLKSIEAIKSFLQANSMKRSKIRQLWAKDLLAHPENYN